MHGYKWPINSPRTRIIYVYIRWPIIYCLASAHTYIRMYCSSTHAHAWRTAPCDQHTHIHCRLDSAVASNVFEYEPTRFYPDLDLHVHVCGPPHSQPCSIYIYILCAHVHAWLIFTCIPGRAALRSLDWAVWGTYESSHCKYIYYIAGMCVSAAQPISRQQSHARLYMIA